MGNPDAHFHANIGP